jgi:hypothetical protein
MAHCVACGEVYDGSNHHCDPKRERKIESARKSHTNRKGAVEPKYGERLSLGFAMMAGHSPTF